jgi:hypothetical protein
MAFCTRPQKRGLVFYPDVCNISLENITRKVKRAGRKI